MKIDNNNKEKAPGSFHMNNIYIPDGWTYSKSIVLYVLYGYVILCRFSHSHFPSNFPYRKYSAKQLAAIPDTCAGARRRDTVNKQQQRQQRLFEYT